MNKISIKTKFLTLMGVIFLVAIAANIAWTIGMQHQQMKEELREQSRALTQEMYAVWDFTSANQDRFEKIAYTETGSYQGLHCAIAGRSIGKMFTRESDYTIHFVNFNPRNSEDEPDNFEADALTVFNDNPNIGEYYGFADYRGEEMFRYSAPMRVSRTCLTCHGEPAGEIDITGNTKEGWTLESVGGAISIVIPLDLYKRSMENTVLTNVLFFVLLLAVVLFLLYIALSRLVTTPLSKIKKSVEAVASGDLDITLNLSESSVELQALASEFDRMAHELSALYGSLETRVENRTMQLKVANEALKEQRVQLERALKQLADDNEYKSQFLAMMSHELRTPLTAIIALAELLAENGETSSDELQAVAQEIVANSRLLLFRINDILAYSGLDAGRIEISPDITDLGDIVLAVRTMVMPLVQENNIRFDVRVDAATPLINADADKIVHVLENLLGNAVKFTPSGGRILLDISPDETGKNVFIRVSDTGIGIAVDHQEKIFERFVQIDSSATRKHSGTGLGLSLARKYIEMHNGTLTVESELGHGSTFTVCLPVNFVEKIALEKEANRHE